MAADATSPTLLSRLRDPADQAAWEEFDALYRDLILRYARGRGLQPQDAEDLRQEVMLALSRTLKGFRYRPELGRFRDYLGTVVRNAVSGHLGRVCVEKPVCRGALESLPQESEAGPDAVWEREWSHHHLRRALQRVRVDFEERSVAIFEELLAGEAVGELARRHGTTVQAIHKVKARVRDRLRELVEEQVRAEEFPGRAQAGS